MRRIEVMFGFVLIGLVLSMGLSSAAVGIYITQEAVLGAEGETVCLTYGAYNPLPGDATIEVGVSPELADMFVSSSWESNRMVIPGNTGSGDAVPVEVCFKIPNNVYDEDRSCEGEIQEFSGSILLTEVNDENVGGSATTAAVSGPVTLRAQCVPGSRNTTLVLFITAVALAIAIIILWFKRKAMRSM